MKKPVLIAGLIFACLLPAKAADLAEGRVYREAVRYCRLVQPSPILNLATRYEVETALAKRFDHSVAVSEDDGIIFHRSPAYVWANETKALCGQAIGYLNGGAIEEETISKCDCYHSQMLRFLRH
ncbi:MAG: hypothetical protein V4691_01565 [Pseudomonadota bacterium]